MLGAVFSSIGQVSLGGQINVSDNIQPFENSSFTFTPAQQLDKGDVLAAIGSGEEAWSVDKIADQFGKPYAIVPSDDNKAAKLSPYPIVGMVSCSDGSVCVIYPGILQLKKNIAVGQIIRSGGYVIKVTKVAKAGEMIPVLSVGDDAILSIESANEKPWFTAYKINTNAKDRVDFIKAWRAEKKYAGE